MTENKPRWCFTERTAIVLRQAGWFPGREIDVSNDLDFFRKFDIDVFPLAFEIVREFHGVIVHYKSIKQWDDELPHDSPKLLNERKYFADIDFSRTEGEADRLIRWIEIVGEPLIPFAVQYVHDFMIAPSGRCFFSFFDQELSLVASSFEELLELVFFSDKTMLEIGREIGVHFEFS